MDAKISLTKAFKEITTLSDPVSCSWISSECITDLQDNFLSMLQPTGLHESKSTQL
jgi:hypothetical protein